MKEIVLLVLCLGTMTNGQYIWNSSPGNVEAEEMKPLNLTCSLSQEFQSCFWVRWNEDGDDTVNCEFNTNLTWCQDLYFIGDPYTGNCSIMIYSANSEDHEGNWMCEFRLFNGTVMSLDYDIEVEFAEQQSFAEKIQEIIEMVVDIVRKVTGMFEDMPDMPMNDI